MTTAELLRETALTAFTTVGYQATSLQQIADEAGVSKASVLYHFDSKEHLLEVAVGPSVERIEQIVAGLEEHRLSPSGRQEFVIEFVDFLLLHRREVHLFVNQSSSLVDVPIIDRALALIQRLAVFCQETADTEEDKIRIGIALAGSAYMLAMGQEFGGEDLQAGSRDALIQVMTELLAPLRSNTARPGARVSESAGA